ncbi:TPA: N-6 DNA methylase [Stenotrophomonas maltophilia]|uniref:N-6 DNA methylase n=1 Tax=Stenotrophomonas muris TaxID=2963283 RepID=UPI00383A8E81
MKKRAPVALSTHETEFYRLARQNSHRHSPHEVFRDFCEMLAIELSNAVDHLNRERRAERYALLRRKYDDAECQRFVQMTACLICSLEEQAGDCLGALFMGMDLGNAGTGQFFTPYPVSLLLAQMTLTDAPELIARNGFITLNEPACGAGGMVIAAAETLRSMGINYQERMHVIAVDIDSTACHMAYIQMALLHIPGVVVHGNALAPQDSWDEWITPAHVLGQWDARLALRRSFEAMRAALAPPADTKPAEPGREAPREPSPAPVPVISNEHIEQRRKLRSEQLALF